MNHLRSGWPTNELKIIFVANRLMIADLGFWEINNITTYNVIYSSVYALESQVSVWIGLPERRWDPQLARLLYNKLCGNIENTFIPFFLYCEDRKRRNKEM